MNIEQAKDYVDLITVCDAVNTYYKKYCLVNYYRSIIPILDVKSFKKNNDAIVYAIKSIGYELGDSSNYNELYIKLTNLLQHINDEVLNYEKSKILDKAVEKSIKNIFRY